MNKFFRGGRGMSFRKDEQVIDLTSFQDLSIRPTKENKKYLLPTCRPLHYGRGDVRAVKLKTIILPMIIFCVLFSSSVFTQSVAQEQSESVLVGEVRSAADERKSNVEDLKRKYAYYQTIYPKIHYDYSQGRTLGFRVGDSLPSTFWDKPLRILKSDGGDDSITLRPFKNQKMLIIDFWTTWCKPCLESIDKWQDMYRKYSDDLEVITVHMDFDYKAAPFIKEREWAFPVVIGQDQVDLNSFFFTQYQVGGQVYISGGKVVAICFGKDSDQNREQLPRFFEHNLRPSSLISSIDYVY